MVLKALLPAGKAALSGAEAQGRFEVAPTIDNLKMSHNTLCAHKTASALTVTRGAEITSTFRKESLIVNSSRCNEGGVIVWFGIDFCSLSKISRLPWAHSKSIYDPLLQSAAVLMTRPQCTWVTFHIVEHILAFVTKQTYSQQ